MARDSLGVRLDRLRTCLRDATDLQTVADLFRTSLVEDPAFLGLGAPYREQTVPEAVADSLARHFGGSVGVAEFCLVRLDEQGFVHGPGSITLVGNGPPQRVEFALFYFEDGDKGFCLLFDGEYEKAYIRFTTVPLAPGAAFVSTGGSA